MPDSPYSVSVDYATRRVSVKILPLEVVNGGLLKQESEQSK